MQEFIYPDHMAYKFGGPNSPRFVIIQIHYDIPTGSDGIDCIVYSQTVHCFVAFQDSSGVHLF